MNKDFRSLKKLRNEYLSLKELLTDLQVSSKEVEVKDYYHFLIVDLALKIELLELQLLFTNELKSSLQTKQGGNALLLKEN